MYRLFIFLFLAGCTGAPPAKRIGRDRASTPDAVRGTHRFHVARPDYRIFPNAEWLFGEQKHFKPSDPTPEEVDQMEVLVVGAFEKFNREHRNDTLLPLGRYKRQYAAVIDDHGNKIVRIQFLSDPEDDSWTKSWLLIQDGGNSVVNMEIDLSDFTVLEFGPNGVA